MSYRTKKCIHIVFTRSFSYSLSQFYFSTLTLTQSHQTSELKMLGCLITFFCNLTSKFNLKPFNSSAAVEMTEKRLLTYFLCFQLLFFLRTKNQIWKFFCQKKSFKNRRRKKMFLFFQPSQAMQNPPCFALWSSASISCPGQSSIFWRGS